MKITKNQLRQIIKEEVSRFQKKTILENRRKEIVKELRMLNENVTKEQIKQIVLKHNKDFYEVEDELSNNDLEIDVYDGHPSEQGAFNIMDSSGNVIISGWVRDGEIESLNESIDEAFTDIFKSKATKEKGYSQNIQESIRKVVREGFLNLLKEEFKSQNYSELLDINKLSEEFGISTSDLKGYIDELQKDREEGDQRLRAERGAGFAPINAESARDSLISLLVRKGILVKAWNIDTKILIDKGVKPGPDFGKFIKDWTSNNAKKYMTPEKYAENIDIFFKERGY